MMRLSLFALAAIALVVNGTPALSERITNKNEFVEKVAGKRLTLRNRPTSVPKGWMTIEADGRIRACLCRVDSVSFGARM